MHEKGPKLSLPQICLSASVMSSGILSMYLIFGPWFQCNANCNAMVYFSNVFVTFYIAGIFVFSFYLVEVTMITSASSAGALKIFKWPAIICIAYIFVIEIITITFFSASVPGVDFNRILPLTGASYIINISLSLILLAVANVLIAKAMFGTSGKFKNTAIRIHLTSALIFVAGIFQMVYYGTSIVTGYLFNGYNFMCYMFAFYWMPPSIIAIVLASNFRLSLSQEIELSKSGTSSTSSGSGSGSSVGSSSSSMQSSDPVIEL